jgi:HlyD family secretion protein
MAFVNPACKQGREETFVKNNAFVRPRFLKGAKLLAILSFGAGFLSGLPAPPSGMAGEKPVDSPSTYTVKRGSLDTRVELTAVFESARMEPLGIDPEVWADLTVVEAVPHGTRVKKDQVLLKLDREKLEDQIAELEQGQPSAKIALELASAEWDNLKQTTPLKMESAERAKRRADEDYAYFQDIDKAQKVKAAEFGVKGAEQRLEGAREELNQLKKMYQADDLTEDTEEIVLKRQKHSVEAAEYFLESAKLNAKRTLESGLPREYENLKSQMMEQDLAYTLAKESLPRNLDQRRIQVEKLKRDQEKAVEKLADLKKDLELMTVRAPIGGIVYYGTCDGGKWTTGAVVAKKLVPGGKIGPREVFMTVVDPENLILRTAIPENKLSRVQTGQTGEAEAVSAPHHKLKVQVRELSYIPAPDGSFGATLSLEKPKDIPLLPGMSCKVTFGDKGKSNVLLVPKEAVIGEGEASHVLVQTEDGKQEKRAVKTGDADDKNVEILEGLAEGDKVGLKPPE